MIGDSLDTRFGTVWSIACGAWILLAAVVLVVLRRPARDGERVPRALLLAGPPAVFVLLLPALAGHGATQSPVGLLFPLITLHVVSVSAWVGGIAALLLVLPAVLRATPEQQRLPVAAAVLDRFSRVAFVAVGIVAVSGAVQAYVLVRHPSALIDTAYGRSVSIKTLLLVALAVVATDNHRRSVPRLRALATAGDPAPAGDDPAPAGGAAPAAGGGTTSRARAVGGRLRRALRIEAGLIVVVLGVTAALSSYQPGADASSTGAPKPFAATRAVGPLRLGVSVAPAAVGLNRIVLRLSDPRTGRPFVGAKEVDLAEALPARDIPALQQTARPAGPSVFVADGAPLSVGGTWTVAVSVRVSEFDEYTTTVDVPVR